MMGKIKAVLFDLDGTTLYTLPDLQSALNFALQLYGFTPRSREDVRRFIGNGLWNLVKRALPPECAEQTDEVLAAMKQYYAVHMTDETVPYDGIPDLLRRLKADGYLLGTVSNKTEDAARALMPVYFDGLMDVCVGELEGRPRKPDAGMVKAALDALGVGPEETVYVGDSDVDVQTAANGDCACIAVTWGYRSTEELRKAGACRFAGDPEELYRLIRAMG